jgi:hypothetical protein
MANDTLTQVEKGVLGFIIAESQQNKDTIEKWIASGEAQVGTVLAQLIKQIPSVKGFAGAVANPILSAVEAGIQNYVAQLLAKETPEALFNYYIALMTKLQADL